MRMLQPTTRCSGMYASGIAPLTFLVSRVSPLQRLDSDVLAWLPAMLIAQCPPPAAAAAACWRLRMGLAGWAIAFEAPRSRL